MFDEKFKRDVKRNLLKPTKRFWWALFFLRLEQHQNSYA